MMPLNRNEIVKSLFLMLSFNMSQASANLSLNTLPAHGRKIEVSQPPKIWDGIGTNSVKVKMLPAVFDLDNDRHIDWLYQWVMDGKPMDNEMSANSIDRIPVFIPPLDSTGKTIQLRLRAVADSVTSYPDESRFSLPIVSNELVLKPAILYSIGTCGTRVPTEASQMTLQYGDTLTSVKINNGELIGSNDENAVNKTIIFDKPLNKIVYVTGKNMQFLRVSFHYIDGGIVTVSGTGTVIDPVESTLDFSKLVSPKGVTVAQLGGCNYTGSYLTGLRFGVAQAD